MTKFEETKQIYEALSLDYVTKFVDYISLEEYDNQILSAISKIENLYDSVLKREKLLVNFIENDLDNEDLDKLYFKFSDLTQNLTRFQIKALKNFIKGNINQEIIFHSQATSIKEKISKISGKLYSELQKRESAKKNILTKVVVPTPVRDWEDYEQRVYKKLKETYPEAEKIIYDERIKGKISQTSRQIDVLAEHSILGEKIRIVFECKLYQGKIDVKAIESFKVFIEQVNADKGVLISKVGFTKGAENTAKHFNISLKVISEKDLENYEFDFDDFANYRIQHLKYNKQEFLKTMKFNTHYIDIDKTSFEKKTIVYKEGYTNTEYYAYKKLLNESMRVFRDFPEIQNIRMITIAHDDKNNERIYLLEISMKELEGFTKQSSELLRKDIKIWRKKVDLVCQKDKILDFGKKYIKHFTYSDDMLSKLSLV